MERLRRGSASDAAALRLARGGASVTLVSAGVGGLQLSQGTLDVLGYAPDRVLRPFQALDAFGAARPEHPYATLGAAAVRAGADFVADAVGPARRDYSSWLGRWHRTELHDEMSVR